MGIKDLKPLLKKYYPTFEKLEKLNQFSNTAIAVDLHIFIYSYLSVKIRDWCDNSSFFDEDQVMEMAENQAIEMLVNKLTVFLNNDIIPICVFDGKTDFAAKQVTNDGRTEKKLKNKAKIAELKEKIQTSDPLFMDDSVRDEYNKAVKSCINPTQRYRTKIHKTLTDLGFIVVDNQDLMATPDGEALCAALCTYGICSAGYTTDTDFLPYGGETWITEVKKASKNKTTVKIVRQSNILKKLDMSQEKFRDMCILLGTDFNNRYKGNGIVTVYEKRIKDKKLDMHVYADNYDDIIKIFKSSNEDFDPTKLVFMTDLIKNFDMRTVIDNIESYNFES